jgi:hypothetical protein
LCGGYAHRVFCFSCENGALAFHFVPYPHMVYKGSYLTLSKKSRSSLPVSNAFEDRSVPSNVRGGINSLMAEVHIRHHFLSPEKASVPPHKLAEDMVDLVRAYLK